MTEHKNPGQERRDEEERKLEDSFFGEPNALRYDRSTVSETSLGIRRAVQTARELGDPADIIKEMQAEGELPQSVHTQTLIECLRYLGQRGFQIFIEGKRFFSGAGVRLDLTKQNLRVFLSRGTVAATLLLPAIASGAGLEPGMAIGEGANAVTNSGLKGNVILNPENIIVAVLLALGVAAGIVLIKKLKKKYPTAEKKDPKKTLKIYEKAKRSGAPSEAEAAKNKLFHELMGELPQEERTAATQIAVPSEKDLERGLKAKKIADAAISKAVEAVEASAVMPEDQDVNSLNEFGKKAVAVADKQLTILDKAEEELDKQMGRAELEHGGQNEYVAKQIEFEKKKIAHIKKYIEWMRKQLLILAQSAKNEAIKAGYAAKLDVHDLLLQKIGKIQQALDNLLNQQETMDPGTFSAQLQTFTNQLNEKTQQAKAAGLPEYQEETIIDPGQLKLANNGEYNHETGIDYSVDGHNRHIDLVPDVNAQIWVNTKREIKLNFNIKNVLVETRQLVLKEQDLYVKMDDGQELPLAEYIRQQQSGDKVQIAEAEEAPELGPEAEPVLNDIATKFREVHGRMKAKEYGVFGKKIIADDEAIEYHNIRVHREYHGKKEKVVIRFTLSEGFWKKTVAHLHQQKGLQKANLPFVYEGPDGETVNVGQNMIKFNVITKGKQATVLVPANAQFRALMGEVRIIFNSNLEYTDEDVKTIFALVAKKLGIQSEIKPETPAARARLQQKIQEISKANAQMADDRTAIHDEYDAEQVAAQYVEQLRSQGLNCVYHSFNPNHLEDMFQTGKVLSTSTRWSKGIMKHGLSSSGKDMTEGGATEVFTRVHTTKSRNADIWGGSGPAIIFSSAVFRRGDCYCYASDQFGSKLQDTFGQRVSPEKLLIGLGHSYNSSHEVMFHDAIDLFGPDARYIVCLDSQQKIGITARLAQMGITQFAGKPLAQAIITRDQFKHIQIQN